MPRKYTLSELAELKKQGKLPSTASMFDIYTMGYDPDESVISKKQPINQESVDNAATHNINKILGIDKILHTKPTEQEFPAPIKEKPYTIPTQSQTLTGGKYDPKTTTTQTKPRVTLQDLSDILASETNPIKQTPLGYNSSTLNSKNQSQPINFQAIIDSVMSKAKENLDSFEAKPNRGKTGAELLKQRESAKLTDLPYNDSENNKAHSEWEVAGKSLKAGQHGANASVLNAARQISRTQTPHELINPVDIANALGDFDLSEFSQEQQREIMNIVKSRYNGMPINPATIANKIGTMLKGNELADKAKAVGGGNVDKARQRVDSLLDGMYSATPNGRIAQTIQSITPGMIESEEAKVKKIHDEFGELTGFKKFLQSGLEPIPNVVESAILGTVTGTGMIPFMTTAGGGYAREAELEGASNLQQLAYGAAGGALEGATEVVPWKRAGEILKATKTGELINQGAKNLIGKYGMAAYKVLSNIGLEGFQEFIMTPLSRTAKFAIYDDSLPLSGEGGILDWSQMVEDFKGGGAMSIILAIMGIPGAAASKTLLQKHIDDGTLNEKTLKEVKEKAINEIDTEITSAKIENRPTFLSELEAEDALNAPITNQEGINPTPMNSVSQTANMGATDPITALTEALTQPVKVGEFKTPKKTFITTPDAMDTLNKAPRFTKQQSEESAEIPVEDSEIFGIKGMGSKYRIVGQEGDRLTIQDINTKNTFPMYQQALNNSKVNIEQPKQETKQQDAVINTVNTNNQNENIDIDTEINSLNEAIKDGVEHYSDEELGDLLNRRNALWNIKPFPANKRDALEEIRLKVYDEVKKRNPGYVQRLTRKEYYEHLMNWLFDGFGEYNFGFNQEAINGIVKSNKSFEEKVTDFKNYFRTGGGYFMAKDKPFQVGTFHGYGNTPSTREKQNPQGVTVTKYKNGMGNDDVFEVLPWNDFYRMVEHYSKYENVNIDDYGNVGTYNSKDENEKYYKVGNVVVLKPSEYSTDHKPQPYEIKTILREDQSVDLWHLEKKQKNGMPVTLVLPFHKFFDMVDTDKTPLKSFDVYKTQNKLPEDQYKYKLGQKIKFGNFEAEITVHTSHSGKPMYKFISPKWKWREYTNFEKDLELFEKAHQVNSVGDLRNLTLGDRIVLDGGATLYDFTIANKYMKGTTPIIDVKDGNRKATWRLTDSFFNDESNIIGYVLGKEIAAKPPIKGEKILERAAEVEDTIELRDLEDEFMQVVRAEIQKAEEKRSYDRVSYLGEYHNKGLEKFSNLREALDEKREKQKEEEKRIKESTFSKQSMFDEFEQDTKLKDIPTWERFINKYEAFLAQMDETKDGADIKEIRDLIMVANNKIRTLKNKLAEQQPTSTPANLDAYGMKIAKTTTSSGKAALEVSGNTKPFKEEIKKAGGRWYKEKSVWTFYNMDNIQELTDKLLKVLPTLSTDSAPQQVESAEQKPTKYGRAGKAAYEKWGRNEYVNADLEDENSLYTKDYKTFFEFYYERGRAGLEAPRYFEAPKIDSHFPPFLEDTFYNAGKKDFEAEQSRNEKRQSAENVEQKPMEKAPEQEYTESKKDPKELEREISNELLKSLTEDQSFRYAVRSNTYNEEVKKRIGMESIQRIAKALQGVLAQKKGYEGVHWNRFFSKDGQQALVDMAYSDLMNEFKDEFALDKEFEELKDYINGDEHLDSGYIRDEFESELKELSQNKDLMKYLQKGEVAGAGVRTNYIAFVRSTDFIKILNKEAKKYSAAEKFEMYRVLRIDANKEKIDRIEAKHAKLKPGIKVYSKGNVYMIDSLDREGLIKLTNIENGKKHSEQYSKFIAKSPYPWKPFEIGDVIRYGVNRDEVVDIIPSSMFKGKNDIVTKNVESGKLNKIPLGESSLYALITEFEGFDPVPEKVEASADSDYVELEEVAEETTNKDTDELEQPNTNDPSYKVANEVMLKLMKGRLVVKNDIIKVADEAFGGTMAENKYDTKDLTDAIELGVNMYLLKEFKETDIKTEKADWAKSYISVLQNTLSLLPTQTNRTAEMDEFQQFSTPPTISFVANWVANYNENDVMLEPSAGVGGLAVFAKVAKVKEIIVNELSDKRLKLIKMLGFDRVFNENAEQLNNILPRDIKPTVIVMNPPFSSSAGRMEGKRDTNFAVAHVEQALKRLQPDGRLVLIVGRGMADDSKTFSDWWRKIKAEYNVRANVGIDGKNYYKYGTSFDIQLIVIDKNGKTENTITGKYESLKEIISALEGVRNERIQPRSAARNEASESSANESNSSESSTKGRGDGGRKHDNMSSTDNVGIGEQQSGSSRHPGNKGTTDGNSAKASNEQLSQENDESDRSKQDTTRPSTRNAEAQDTESTSGISDRGNKGIPSSEESTVKIETKQREKHKEKELTDSVYENYKPQKLKINGAKAHPGFLAESAAMAAVEPPDPTYTPNLPKEIITKGILSDVQLETVVYAGQAHAQTLPDGKRRGFFNGDGTGVGKGRQIAGIILDNFRQGRTKAIWVTKNEKLLQDARRDWEALGGDPKDIMWLGKTKLGEAIKANKGIILTTYKTLAYNMEVAGEGVSVKKGKKDRLSQVANWLGENFEGAIAFDEAHMMQNCLQMKGARGMKKPSASALAGVDLQNRMPNARISYFSATGATEVHNLGYATRLGVWGVGTAFAHVRDFVTKIHAGGLAAMELIARDLKAQGLYISRTLSFDGVKYRKKEHPLTKEQTKMYDTMAHAWQIVLQNMEEALQLTGQSDNKNARRNAASKFWGAHQRFFNQVLTALQMPTAIEDIKEQLEKGNVAVLQIVNTNEASMERQIEEVEEEDGDLEDIDLTPREMLLQYLDVAFPTLQYETYIDENGNEKSRVVTDKDGNPVHNTEALAMKDALIEEISELKVPEAPLEIVLNTFGVDVVAEVTGRQRRVIRVFNEDTQRYETKIEKRTDTMVDEDVAAFMNDKKKILIFSDAGGTGKSYHADRTAKNQRKRIHYLIQAGWRADGAVQGFGRTHRTNQASEPEYVLVSTNLKGQKRFISTIARRLDQLGAMTKGQRETGSQGLFSASDNLESPAARDALKQFYLDLFNRKIPGLNFKEVTTQMGIYKALYNEEDGTFTNEDEKLKNVPKFLNRLLSLSSTLQNQVFDEFTDRLTAIVEWNSAHGILDNGLENLKADKIEKVDESTIRVDELSNAETKYIQLKVSNKTTPVSYERILKNVPENLGFYQNAMSKNVRLLAKGKNKTLESGEVVATYKLFDQLGDYDMLEESAFKRSNWGKISNDTARDLWSESVAKIPEYKDKTVHMISGLILPIWDRLPQGHVRVYRAITESGEMILGRTLEDKYVDSTLRRLGAERAKGAIDYEVAIRQILEDDYTAYLSNGWKISRRRVAGQYRIEIIGEMMSQYRPELSSQGVFNERIGYETRYFIPTGIDAAKVLRAVTQYRPITDMVAPNESPAIRAKKTVKGSTALATQQPQSQNPSREFTLKKGEKPKSIPRIIGDISRIFKVTITNKRHNRRSTEAFYMVRPEVIVSKKANALEPILHELGHHLDKRYHFSEKAIVKLGGKGGTQYNKGFTEMISKLPLEFVNAYSKSELPGEAVAEFVKTYVLDLQSAKDFSSEFMKVFEYTLTKEDLKNINDIANDVNNWMRSSKIDQAKTTMSSHFDKDKSPLSVRADKFYQEFQLKMVDRWNPLKNFTKLVEELSGKKVPASLDPYVLAHHSADAAAMAEFSTQENMVNPQGEIVREGLSAITKKIDDKDYIDFNLYVKVVHAIDWHEQNKQVFVDQITIDDLIEMKEDLEKLHPEFKDIAEELYDWWGEFIQLWLVDTGLLPQEIFDEMREVYPHYVPNYRDMNYHPDMVSVNSVSKGFNDKRNPMKRATKDGSDRNTYLAIESFILDIDRIIKTVKQREVALAIHKLYNHEDYQDGLGLYLHRIPPKMLPQRFDATTLKEKLIMKMSEDALKQLPDGEIEKLRQMTRADKVEYILNNNLESSANIVDSMMDDVITYFIPQMIDKDRYVFTVIDEGGKPVFYEVSNPYFLRALTNLNPQQLPFVLRMIAAATRAFKLVTTGNNPFFGVTSNFSRDLHTGYIRGRNFDPITYLGKTFISVSDVIKNTPEFKQHKAMGGAGGASAFSSERNRLNESLNKLVPGRSRKHWLSYGVGKILEFNDAIELAPRLNEKGDMSTYDGRLETMMRRKDVTINFNRWGEWIKIMDAFLPFLNVAIQDLDALRRTATEDREQLPGRIMRAIVAITIPAILVQIFLGDDEDYKKLSRFTKDNYFVFKVDGGFVKIPLPRTYSVLFGSVWQRTFDSVFRKNPMAWKDYRETLEAAFLPPTRTIFAPLIDVAMNKTWYGGSIVDPSIEGEPQYEYDETTSELSKTLAKINSYIPDVLRLEVFSSPKKLDYLIDQYTGILGDIALPLMTKTIGANNAGEDIGGRALAFLEKNITRKVFADPTYSTDVLNDFYDYRSNLEKYKNTIDREIAVPKEFQPDIYRQYNKQANYFRDLRKLSLEIEKSDLPKPEKQRMIKNLRAVQIKIAAELNEVYEMYLRKIKETR